MLVLLGANHRSAPLDVRERMAFSESQLQRELQSLTSRDDIQEALILSTCNRVEVLARAASAQAGLEAIKSFLVEGRRITPGEIDHYTYHYAGREAVRHVFHVASGLDSMILGEPQITGQVKQAYRAAKQVGAAGTVLEKLLQQSLSTAKRLRTETGISRQAVSIAFAAVELARQIFGELRGRSALVLGAGTMASLVATHLVSKGVDRLVVSILKYNRAARVAERFGGRAIHWDAALAQLDQVDIVVSGTGAAELVLGKRDVQQALRARRGQPLFLIDIAVPRDVDPAVNALDNVYLYDIDDLQGVVDTNIESRNRAAAKARALVSQEVESFERWLQSLTVAPTIVSLRETLLGVGEREVARFRKRLEPLVPEQEQAVRELARAIIQKILHRPIRHLKASVGRGEAVKTAELVREVFGIDESAGDEAQRKAADRPSGKAPHSGGPQRLIKGGKDH